MTKKSKLDEIETTETGTDDEAQTDPVDESETEVETEAQTEVVNVRAESGSGIKHDKHASHADKVAAGETE